MTINPAHASPCGLYCGACAILIAHRDNKVKFKERLVTLYQGGIEGKGTLPGSETLTVDDIRCVGCLSDDRFMHCEQYEIGDCTQTKRIEGCHECGDFPCAHIDDFSMALG